MNAEDAAALLPLYRPGRPADSRLQKAVRTAEKDPALAQQLAEQQAFDDRITEVIRSITPPADLMAKLRQGGARTDAPPPKLRSQAFHPVVLTAILGVLLIAGFIGWTVMERMEKFDGKEAVERIVATPRKMSGLELDNVNSTTGSMQDWFYMRGFEGFHVPPELAGLPVVGSRVFRIEGHAIAQLAVDKNESILYVFRASDFGVDVPADQPWRLMEHDGWAAALRRQGDICSVLAFRGTKGEMKTFLTTLQTP